LKYLNEKLFFWNRVQRYEKEVKSEK